MSAPQVSVVVPVRDGERELGGLLASLEAQTLARDRFEVLVVDNASRDRSPEVARRHGARVLSEPVPGRARARNLGAAAAQAPLLAFIDADCVAGRDWLAALLGCSARAELVAGEVEVTAGTPPTEVERFEALWRFDQRAWVRQGWAATANLLVQRAAFEAIGGFDTAYRSIGEDADFCIRAGRAGFALVHCAAARVEHRAEARLWPMLRRSFWHGYSSAQVSRRVGAGYRAWRRPRPLLDRSAAARAIGIDPGSLPSDERPAMERLARRAYWLRVIGSVWSEVRRAR